MNVGYSIAMFDYKRVEPKEKCVKGNFDQQKLYCWMSGFWMFCLFSI